MECTAPRRGAQLPISAQAAPPRSAPGVAPAPTRGQGTHPPRRQPRAASAGRRCGEPAEQEARIARRRDSWLQRVATHYTQVARDPATPSGSLRQSGPVAPAAAAPASPRAGGAGGLLRMMRSRSRSPGAGARGPRRAATPPPVSAHAAPYPAHRTQRPLWEHSAASLGQRCAGPPPPAPVAATAPLAPEEVAAALRRAAPLIAIAAGPLRRRRQRPAARVGAPAPRRAQQPQPAPPPAAGPAAQQQAAVVPPADALMAPRQGSRPLLCSQVPAAAVGQPATAAQAAAAAAGSGSRLRASGGRRSPAAAARTPPRTPPAASRACGPAQRSLSRQSTARDSASPSPARLRSPCAGGSARRSASLAPTAAPPPAVAPSPGVPRAAHVPETQTRPLSTPARADAASASSAAAPAEVLRMFSAHEELLRAATPPLPRDSDGGSAAGDAGAAEGIIHI
eukprot:TRINITY_DN14200_c0_g1_i3.p3 TRINITY_DN14200_c0_g1~~TRINITY_DN14200_c0_g1_i3.p3  ORF type:complete len:453 (+),score=33.17 TRINITY_DN14200_c0_g1_i3:68-1426(+)